MLADFSILQASLISKRRSLITALIIGAAALAAICVLVSFAQPGIWNATAPLLVLSFFAALWLSCVSGTLTSMLSREKIPGIGVGSWIGAAMLTFFAVSSDLLPSAVDQARGAPLYDPGTGAPAIFLSCWFVVLVLGISRVRRLKRVIPQGYEFHYCRRLLQELLREVPPNARCRVSLNSFPIEWSSFERQIRGRPKAATFDCLLAATLPLGSGKSLDLQVVHRRTGKGRRKHKGFKHKVKVKCTFRALSAEDISTRRSLQSDFLTGLQHALAGTTPEPSPWSFAERVPSGAAQLIREGNQVSVVLTTVNPCTSARELKPADLLSPQIVLTAVRQLFIAAHPHHKELSHGSFPHA